MSFLPSLPEDVLKFVMTNFLTAESNAKLDTAFCNYSQRSTMLNVLKHVGFVMESEMNSFDSGNFRLNSSSRHSLFMKWIAIRRIKLNSLYIDHTDFDSRVYIWNSLDISRVEFIHLNLTGVDSSENEDVLMELDILPLFTEFSNKLTSLHCVSYEQNNYQLLINTP